ncbi:NupC/NupG family nucleoside CNT transporter [Paenibacillus sp. FSL R10-2734]|uniref:NupC/NupG family nucleoside CNT transporter n=1 Tax=Paenibacillus sp. FSL R10-2734 TaxID=2954691 RepID=UPI0030DB0E5E
MSYLWGLIGILCILGITFLFSTNKRKINLRTIAVALAIQIAFAFIVLKWPLGRSILQKVTDGVNAVIGYANEGINFLVGGIYTPESGITHVFLFNVLGIIIFFSALISVLYYIGIMQFVIKYVGGALSKLLGTKKAETFSATANIFVGLTEAPLVIKPFIDKLTISELFSVMVCGLASVSGSVLVGYSLLGVPLEYLLAASVMSAPAGLVLSKIMIPETEGSQEEVEGFEMARDDESSNVIDAAANGAATGLQLALNVGAMLLAFIALIALINGILGFVGGWFGFDQLSIELILSYVFAPLAFIIGVPWDEALTAGNFIGQKLIINEFVAYSNFAPLIDTLSQKSVVIISFALCGFANFSSLGILLGGLGKLSPKRRPDIARLGVKAIIAGALASCLSAAIAGMIIG